MTAGGRRHPLPDPFFVLATQNPIEQEGTYPLPEAQLDRFLFKIFITYPKPEEERKIYRLTTGVDRPEITPMLTGERIASLAAAGASGSRVGPLHRLRDGPGPRDARPRSRRPALYRRMGRVGRRAAGRAVARFWRPRLAPRSPGRPSVSIDDIRWVALPVLRHRIVINYNAQAAGETSDSIIKKLLEDVPIRKGAADAAVAEVFRS